MEHPSCRPLCSRPIGDYSHFGFKFGHFIWNTQIFHRFSKANFAKQDRKERNEDIFSLLRQCVTPEPPDWTDLFISVLRALFFSTWMANNSQGNLWKNGRCTITLHSYNEVVWTLMKFKICLYFWGGFGPWRGSVASYTTDERAKTAKKKGEDWI